MNADLAERRRQQVELYGDSVDVLAQKVQQVIGMSVPDLADVIGLSVPMLTKLLTGERVRIGNPIAIARLTRLREFVDQLISGEAHRDEIQLTIAQIRASTTPARPSKVTAVAKASGPGGGPGSGAPGSGAPGAGPGPGAPGSGAAVTQAPTSPKGSDSGAGSGGPRTPVPTPALGEFPSVTTTSLNYARQVVGRHVKPTPAYRWPLLERFTHTETWVKHENHSPTGAFKVRGGLNFIERMRVSGIAPPPGLISATRGNHGQSLAFSGRQYKIPVTIVVPEDNNLDQNSAMEALGAEVVVHGSDFQSAREHAGRLAGERGMMMVPPFHSWLVEGIATYAAELHEAVPGLDIIYVPIGMGSGICANIAVRDLLGLNTEIVGVVADAAPAYALSFEAGEVVSTETADTFVDGVACRTPDPVAVQMIRRGASRIVRVSEEDAAEAMVLAYRTTHNLAEPAGSLALAGLLADTARPSGKKAAIVQTGGNCDFETLARVTAENT